MLRCSPPISTLFALRFNLYFTRIDIAIDFHVGRWRSNIDDSLFPLASGADGRSDKSSDD
jgi:hypothetical protein